MFAVMRKTPVLPKRRVSFSDDLISKSVSGDPAALEELASKCLPQVWHTVFLVCGGGPDVDDIVQNAIIDAFTGLGTYRGTGDFAAWLNRIAVRAVYRYKRRRAFWSLIPSSDRLEHLADYDHTGPDKKAETRRLLGGVSRHLGAIKLRNRVAVVLSLVHGYSVSEIAATVGCSIEAAKKRLQRGRLDLGKRIQKDPDLRDMLREVGL
jgi:RNA polymerase sigma-70 factor (ECF subfamily)